MRPGRVLVTKIGFDGHDRGSRLLARALRDAGLEVIYTAPWQALAAIVQLALQEDVDVIGISSLATDHLLVPRLIEALRASGLDDVPVIVGGIVPPQDEVLLLAAGVRRVFHPGQPLEQVVSAVRALVAQRCGQPALPRQNLGTMSPDNDGEQAAAGAGREPEVTRRDDAAIWQRAYAVQVPQANDVRNRSGLLVNPLYTPADLDPGRAAERLAFPGQPPYTRGIYASMHRGRTWSQRQLTGLGTPSAYNARLREVLQAGATAISLLPCNSVFRGYDADEVPPELLGTCGVVVNTWQQLDACLAGVDLETVSIGLNDPLPFGLLACLLVVARRRGQSWERLSGTSNQSDYLSHFVANHMFLRLSLAGSQRVLLDQIDFCLRHLPRWNPLSVVGQHMQQAGATPAQAMAFTLASALQHARDCQARGLDPERFLPRFTFFFDISLSFFEEVAKFRAGRRLWAKLTRETLGARDPRAWRLKFHAQTSGADLTRQQPLNNITRVAVQAMAGIFGGLQSLHTDAYDEALACPGGEPARLAVATQNILRDEAGLADVIDPLGGSYYVEALTDRMEDEIARVLADVEAAGGMRRAVEAGLVQRQIGEAAARFQARVESGAQVLVGVNAYEVPEGDASSVTVERPDLERMRAHADDLRRFKRARSASAVTRVLDDLARAAQAPRANLFEASVAAIEGDATHGEVCAVLSRELGFGQPLLEP